MKTEAEFERELRETQLAVMDRLWERACRVPDHRTDLRIFRFYGYGYDYTAHEWRRVFAPGLYNVTHVSMGCYGPFEEASCSVAQFPSPKPVEYISGEGSEERSLRSDDYFLALGKSLTFKASWAFYAKFWKAAPEAMQYFPGGRVP